MTCRGRHISDAELGLLVLLRGLGMTYKELSRIFGVTESAICQKLKTIRRIIVGKTKRHNFGFLSMILSQINRIATDNYLSSLLVDLLDGRITVDEFWSRYHDMLKSLNKTNLNFLR